MREPGSTTEGVEDLFIVLCKPPGGSATKTRLAKTVGRRTATALYQQCLIQVLTTVAAMEGSMRVSVAGDPMELAPLCLAAAPHAELVRQRGASFEECQSCEIDRALHEGFSNVILVASDLPVLPLRAIEWATATARSGAIGLIPSPDGGYSLLGTSQPVPELSRVPMSQEDTCQALAQAVRSTGKRVSIADFAVSDLDRIEDLAGQDSNSIVSVLSSGNGSYDDDRLANPVHEREA